MLICVLGVFIDWERRESSLEMKRRGLKKCTQKFCIWRGSRDKKREKKTHRNSKNCTLKPVKTYKTVL